MRVLTILCSILALAIQANAATYYVSSAGSDANNGTSTATPWAHHPYMRNFVGAYTHAAGDRFVFRGGDSWGNACFTMQVTAGGTPGTPDYYGVDQTWFTGTTWTRPVFDAGGVELAGGYDVMVLLSLANAPHDIVFDNLDLRNLFWTGAKSFSQVAFFNLSVSQNVTIQNCFLHNWTHGTAGAGTSDALKCVVGANSSPFNYGCQIVGCVIDGENAANSTQGQSSGEATIAYSGNVLNTVARNMASGFIVTGAAGSTTPQVVSGCEIGPTYMSFDSGAHPDALFMNGGSLFYWHDNYIHDNAVENVFCGNGSGGENTYIWNNVIWSCPTHSPVEIDNISAASGHVYLWNNTLVGGSFPAVRVVNRGNGPLGSLDLRNNHGITDSSVLSIDAGAGVTLLTNANNVAMSTASAFVNGYVAASRYQPTANSSATVGAGQAMATVLSGVLTKDILGISRPQGATWDAGAYEFMPNNPGAVSLAASSYSILQGGGSVPVTATRSGGSYGAISIPVATHDGTATAGVDYTALSSNFTWADGQLGALTLPVNVLSSGASVNRTFTVGITSTGTASWANRFGGTLSDGGHAVATDGAGNIYVSGWFSGTAAFGSTNLVSAGGMNLFLVKLDASGSLVWAKGYGSTGDETVTAIALDASGNIFLGGYFTGTGNFGGSNLTSAGNSDIFIAKYNSAGNHLWSQRFGAADLDALYALAVDASGNVIVTGTYRQTVNFGGGPLFSILGGDTGFLAKYDAGGAYVWAQRLDGGSSNFGRGVAVDASGNIYLTGWFNLWINLGQGQMNTVNPGAPNVFVAKYNSLGTNLWAKAHGDANTVKSYALAIDSNNDVAIAGTFHTQTDMGGGTITGTALFADTFVAKYLGADGSFSWARVISDTLECDPLGLAADAANNILLTGYYYGTVNVGGTTFSSVSGSYDVLFAKYSSAGAVAAARTFGGPSTDQGYAVVADSSANPVIVGVFQSTGAFNGQSLTSAGSYDAFAMKIASGPALGPITTETVTIVAPPTPPQPTNAGSITFTASNYATTSASGSVTLTVVRSGSTNIGTTVNFATANGTALAGTDYTSASGTLTWAVNENSSKTITVPILNSGATGTSRVFSVTLSNPSNGATLGTATATVTIQLPPTPNPGTISLSAAAASVSENSTNIVITAVRSSGPDDGIVTVQIATFNQSAVAGHDYTAVSSTLSWGNGVGGNQSVNVPILQSGDTAVTNRTFLVTISSPTGGATLASPTVQTVTIIMNPPVVSAGTVTLSSTNYSTTSSSGSVNLTVIRSGATNAAASVNYATANGTALAGTDYTATSGVLAWATNDNSSRTITVPILNSGATGTNRVFRLALNSPSGGVTLGIAAATVTIQLPAPSPGSIALSASTASVSENSPFITITAVRGNGTNGVVSVHAQTSDLTAVAGHDYSLVSTDLTWADGAFGNQTFNVPILPSGDTATTNRTFRVTLSAVTGGASLGSPSVETVTIIMNPPPTSAGNITLSASNYATTSTSGSVVLSVIRSGASNLTTSVTYATANGTATSGVDYTSTSGTLSWGSTENSTKTITVPILNSGAVGTARVFTVTLSGPSNGATLGVSSATVTIQLPPPVPGSLSLATSAGSVPQNGGTISVSMVRTGGTNGAVSVTASTADGSATAGVDYTTTSFTANWADGDTAIKTFTVPIINSGIQTTTNRTFTISLSGVTGGAVIGAPNTETVTILMPAPTILPGTIAFTQTAFSVSLTAGSVTVAVARTGGTNQPVSVDYTTFDGLAKAGTDYTATSGTLSWTANQNTSQDIVVPITNSGKQGSPVNFTVALSNPTNGANLGAALASVSITLNPVVVPVSGVAANGKVIFNGSVSITFK